MNKNGNQELKKGLKRGRVFLACLIAFVLVFSQIGVPVFAETDTNVRYWDRGEGKEKTVSAEVITSDMTNWGEGSSASNPKWYVVKGTVTIENTVKVTGSVGLILADGAMLKAEQGIEVFYDNSLTIYGQTDQVTDATGKIEANGGGGGSAGIGGADFKAGGNISITGGRVTAINQGSGAGIGGGLNGGGGTITISGGRVTAKSTTGAGIGKGKGGFGDTFRTGDSGTAFIEASSISDTSGETDWKGILFNGDNGKVCGKQTLSEDFRIPTGKTLTVTAGSELTVPEGITLRIDGKLDNQGKIVNNGKISKYGTITGNAVEGNSVFSKTPHSTPVAVIDYRAEKLTNLTPGISYRITPEDGSEQTITPDTDGKVAIRAEWFGKEILIVAKEDDSHVESQEQHLQIRFRNALSAEINYREEKIILDPNASYQIALNGGNWEEVTSTQEAKVAIRPEWLGKTLSIRKKADDYNFTSKPRELHIPLRPDAPSGLQGVDIIVLENNGGKITGTTAAMEYKLSNANNWTMCTDGEVSVTAWGNYVVRFAPINCFVSEAVEIEIRKGYRITVEHDGNGTGTATPRTAATDEEVTLTAVPNDGYQFKKWEVLSPDELQITGNTFIMPDGNVKVKAIFEKYIAPAPRRYHITVENDGGGTATANRTRAAKGREVTIRAEANPGYQFKQWEITADVRWTDGSVYSDTATFRMPAEDVIARSVFQKISEPSDGKFDLEDIRKDAVILEEKTTNLPNKEWTIRMNMNLANVNKEDIYLLDREGQILQTTVTFDPAMANQLVLVPAQPYISGERYYVLIRKEGLQSESGKKLSKDVLFSFVYQQ